MRFPESDFLSESKLKDLAQLLPPPPQATVDKMDTDEDPVDMLEVSERQSCNPSVWTIMVYTGSSVL